MKIKLGSEDWPFRPRNTRPVRPDQTSFSARRRGLPPLPLPPDGLMLDLAFEEEAEEPETAQAAAKTDWPPDHLLEAASHVTEAMREVHLAVGGLMPAARGRADLDRIGALLDESGELEETAQRILEICGELLE